MINLADKLTAKTVEGILADSNEIKYTKEMGDTAKAETVAKELSNITDSMSGLSNSVTTLSQEFGTAQSNIEQLLNKAEQYTDRFVDNPIANRENAGLMSAADKTKLDSYPDNPQDISGTGQAEPWIDIDWSNRNMNDFVDSGEYYIHGNRTDASDNLPIINVGGGHTINARLTVLNSSLNSNPNDKANICVTQILRLSNRKGGDGHVYVRTGQGANTNEFTWGTWEKLMGIFEKNNVLNIEDIDSYTTNGMYSGVYASESMEYGGIQFFHLDTFLMITINGYAVSKLATPQITQLLYKLPTNNSGQIAEIYIRTGFLDVAQNRWSWGPFLKTVTNMDLNSQVTELNTKIRNNTNNITNIVTAVNTVQEKNTEQDTRLNNIESRLDTDIAGATTAAQEAQAAATTAIENAEQAQVIANEAKTTAEGIAVKAEYAIKKATEATVKADAAGTAAIEAQKSGDAAQAKNTEQDSRIESIAVKADTATRMLRFSSIIYDANIEQEEASISPDFLIVFVKGKGLFVASNGGKYYKVFPGSDDYNTTLDGVTKARQDRLFFIQSLEENKYYHYDGVDLRYLITSEPEIAGRVWNEDNGTPKAESYYGSLKALRDLPKRLGLGRYLVTDDRKRKKLDPNDSHKYLDGSPAALDGSEGQCMWCWNGFYANVWHEGSRLIKAVTFDGPVGGETSVWIPAGGISWLGAGVMDRTNNVLCSVINNSEQFRGGNGVALDPSNYSKAPAADSPQITMLGMPATMMSTTLFGEAARRRGEGWEANWFVARFVVEFLFEVIMGTEDSQEAFNGNKDANGLYQGGFGTWLSNLLGWSNYNGEYPVIPTSVGLEAGDGVCLVPYSLPNTGGAEGAYHTSDVPVFFGLVGAVFGHLWHFVRGMVLYKGEEKSLAYVAPSMYSGCDHTTVEGKICTAEYARKSGYIMRKSYRGLCCAPTETGGSPVLRYADYLYTNVDYTKGSVAVRSAGGCAGLNNSMGISATIDYQGTTVAKTQYTAPLCYFTEDPIIPDSQSIENNS